MTSHLRRAAADRRRRWGRSAWDRLYRRRVGPAKFAIVSNNCFGGVFYQRLGRPYNTPFVGLFLFPDDYLTLPEKWDELLPAPVMADLSGRDGERAYPVGRLGGADGLAVHFLRDSGPAAAVAAWDRRRDWFPADRNRLRVKLCDRDGCTEAHRHRFHVLPFPHQVCFVSRPEMGGVYVPGFEDRDELPDDLANHADRHFDTARWLRGERAGAAELQTPPVVRAAHEVITRVQT